MENLDQSGRGGGICCSHYTVCMSLFWHQQLNAVVCGWRPSNHCVTVHSLTHTNTLSPRNDDLLIIDLHRQKTFCNPTLESRDSGLHANALACTVLSDNRLYLRDIRHFSPKLAISTSAAQFVMKVGTFPLPPPSDSNSLSFS